MYKLKVEKKSSEISIIAIASVFLAVQILPYSAFCAIYYVDYKLPVAITKTYSIANRATNGIDGTAFNTLYRANRAVKAGDIVYIRGGTEKFEVIHVGKSDSKSEGIYPAVSGTGPYNKITYSAYPGEKVHFMGNTPFAGAIMIINKNWIKVTGYDGFSPAMNLKFSNMLHFVQMHDGRFDPPYGKGSSYNEISHCEFMQTNSIWITKNPDATGSRIFHNSSYNWVHHCKFHKMGGYPGSSPKNSPDVCSCLDLGWEDCGIDESDSLCHDNSEFNVIEDNKMFHCGHHIMLVANPRNVIRNNIMHNEQWYHAADGLWYGYRVIQTNGRFNENYHLGYNLFEGNRISHATNNMNHSMGGEALHLSTSNNIVRYNDFYANGSNTIYIEAHRQATTARINFNHIYNNTFFANGYQMKQPNAYWPFGGLAPIPDRCVIHFYSGASDKIFAKSMVGNVIKNNIAWKNQNARFAASGRYNSVPAWGLSGCKGVKVCGNTIFDHNFTAGDPKFKSEGSYGKPTISPTNVDWYWPKTPDGSDITKSNVEPDFNLKSSSPAIDKGTFLTKAKGSGNNSKILIVSDAKYFQPGWGNGAGGGASVKADWIAIGKVSNTVQISSIDYYSNTITLASPKKWLDSDPVWLYKNSNGVNVLFGNAPDCGAHEHSILPATKKMGVKK